MESIAEKYSAPQRQSKVAIGIILIKLVRQTIKAFWPILLSFFIGGKNGNSFIDYVGYIALAFAALNVFGSILTFFRFYFHIEDGAIVIDKGVLKRSKVNIPFERIQTINFQQNILHQMFGVVSLEIDTAGAGKAELTIDALNKEEAEAIRQFILTERKAVISEEDSSEESLEEEKGDTILHLGISDLIKIGVSQNHLRSMGLLFAFVFSTMNEVTDDITGLVESQVDGYESFLANNKWAVVALSILLVAFISFVYSIISITLSNYDLKLSLKKNGLKLVRGLLNRQEISVNKKKVQVVSWSDNPIRRLFNMYTLQIDQASSTDAAQLKSKIKVPGSYQHQIDKVAKNVFPAEYYRPEKKNKVNRILLTRIIVLVGIIPALIAQTLYFALGWYCLLFLLWIPLISSIANMYYRKRSFELNQELLKNSRGTFGNMYELLQLRKIQAIQIKQSWYQRRKKLANVTLFTASGSIKIPFLDLNQAEDLEKYVLYKVESDKRGWM